MARRWKRRGGTISRHVDLQLSGADLSLRRTFSPPAASFTSLAEFGLKPSADCSPPHMFTQAYLQRAASRPVA